MEAIKIDKIVKRYKDVTALNGVSLDIKEGELFSILGENGAGKSTLINVLTTLVKPTDGDAYILGESVVKSSDKAKAVIGLCPQETAVSGNLSVKNNMDLICSLYGIEKSDREKIISEVSKKLKLTDVLTRKAKTLSGGMKRRLSIAMGLIANPKVLFLDEPTVALDVRARRDLWELIKELKGKMTIVLTTHYLEEAEALSDRIAVLSCGEIKAIGTAKELKDMTGKDNIDDAFIALVEGR